MTYDGRNYFTEIIGIFTILFIISAFLFCIHNKLGILFVFGLFFYLMFFTYRDKKMKKEDLNNLLAPKKYIKRYKQTLSEEIP
jgi:hypothetical protein